VKIYGFEEMRRPVRDLITQEAQLKAVLSALLLVLVLGCLATMNVEASSSEEISLFDSKGKPVAYIADDDDQTIYLWDGKPAAYLYGDDWKAGIDVYGFNGKHLGWFKGGIMYDHDGYAVGGIKRVFTSPVQLEPLKSLKELKPLKSLKGASTPETDIRKNLV
jgi:hypothetical protein